MDFLFVGLGGFFGAIARYLVYLGERSIGAHLFPYATLMINVGGCFLAGCLLGAVDRAIPIHRSYVFFGSMGLIASFTTFSTLSVESFQLLRSNQVGLAVAHVVGNAVFGIGAVAIGRFLVVRIF